MLHFTVSYSLIVSHDGQETFATLTRRNIAVYVQIPRAQASKQQNLTSRLAEGNGIETEAKRTVQARQDGGKVRSFVQALFIHSSALHRRRCSRHWISCAGYFQFHESPEEVDKRMVLRRNMLLFHR